MGLSYPTRNEIRGILSSLVNQNHSRSAPNRSFKSWSDWDEDERLVMENGLIKDLCSHCILCYEKKHNISFVKYVFTNALVDMFPNMNVDDESYVHTAIALERGVTSESIDSFFINSIGEKLETFIEKFSKGEQSYTVKISSSGASTYNPVWFNNAEKFIHPLLSSYQEFKQSKGMLFQKNDIKQIPIDYAVVNCYNHYIQNGYLNKGLISSIVKKLTDAANDCLQNKSLQYSDIEYIVSKDILNPKSVKAAFDFITKL
jgi:hypothetical protein